jgi:hypothetical protein
MTLRRTDGRCAHHLLASRRRRAQRGRCDRGPGAAGRLEGARRELAGHGLSFSCGVATLAPGGLPADAFRAADRARYEAKRAGQRLERLADALHDLT